MASSVNATTTALLDTSGDYAWVMSSTALVFMMVPGIALFYSGLRSQAAALPLIWLNMMAVSIVSVQWYLIGYSLTFSGTSPSAFVGDASNACFIGTTDPGAFASVRAGDTPALLFGLFQGMFAAFTMALVTGSIGEKGRLLPFLIFCLFWTTIVYDPIAYWMWNFNGWSNKQGSLDWAGGTPVHITSGAASLSYALMMKYNRILSEEKESKLTPSWHAKSIWGRYFAFIWRWPSQFSLPTKSDRRLASHNMTNATLGCMLLWFGWFGFNAGSELKANMRAASTFLASNLAACTGGITFCLLEQRKKGHRWTCLGFCTGAIAGLVAITPGAGYVPAWAGLIYGVTVSIFCYFIMSINSLKAFLEEPLDIAILHGLGGLWGMFMTGIFAETKVIKLDGTDEGGGAISGRAFQIGYQILGGLAGFSWSFGVTLILLIALQIAASYWPPLALRSEDKEVRRREGGRVRGRMKWMIGEELGKNQPYRIICRYHRLPARTADPSNPNNTEDVEYEYEYDEEENEDDSLRDDHGFEHDHDHSQGSVSAASGESMQMSELNAHTNGRSGGGEHGRSVSQVSAMTAVTVTGPS